MLLENWEVPTYQEKKISSDYKYLEKLLKEDFLVCFWLLSFSILDFLNSLQEAKIMGKKGFQDHLLPGIKTKLWYHVPTSASCSHAAQNQPPF